jgi:hypothetical protein
MNGQAHFNISEFPLQIGVAHLLGADQAPTRLASTLYEGLEHPTPAAF